ncbi:MAG: hypothetical protein HY423_03875 [Candidatus Lambdaproteobacteria bacterium]|nr:hypothetical protein [Candidatus Lambdaproteobacteria bacterium]
MNTNLESRLELVAQAHAFPSRLLERLGQWVETAPEERLYRINPLLWAAEQQADENLVVDLFLHATMAGIFALVWSVLCTQCGMLITTPGGLRALAHTQRYCKL